MFAFLGFPTSLYFGSWSCPMTYALRQAASLESQILEMEMTLAGFYEEYPDQWEGMATRQHPEYCDLGPASWSCERTGVVPYGTESGIPHQFPGHLTSGGYDGF